MPIREKPECTHCTPIWELIWLRVVTYKPRDDGVPPNVTILGKACLLDLYCGEVPWLQAPIYTPGKLNLPDFKPMFLDRSAQAMVEVSNDIGVAGPQVTPGPGGSDPYPPRNLGTGIRFVGRPDLIQPKVCCKPKVGFSKPLPPPNDANAQRHVDCCEAKKDIICKRLEAAVTGPPNSPSFGNEIKRAKHCCHAWFEPANFETDVVNLNIPKPWPSSMANQLNRPENKAAIADYVETQLANIGGRGFGTYTHYPQQPPSQSYWVRVPAPTMFNPEDPPDIGYPLTGGWNNTCLCRGEADDKKCP